MAAAIQTSICQFMAARPTVTRAVFAGAALYRLRSTRRGAADCDLWSEAQHTTLGRARVRVTGVQREHFVWQRSNGSATGCAGNHALDRCCAAIAAACLRCLPLPPLPPGEGEGPTPIWLLTSTTASG